MPNITAADVKRLRDATGAGMMDAKKALEGADGDFDQAVEALRIKGAAKAAKRSAERTTSNGLVAAEGSAMIVLACETDFVAKNADFQKLAADIVGVAETVRATDVDTLLGSALPDGRKVAEAIDAAAAVIGEKLELTQVAVADGEVTTYLHRRSGDLPPQVGVLVRFDSDGSAPARQVAYDAAMQVAALRPQYAVREDVPEDVVENERRIAEATAREEGKPDQALPKIIEGRVNGFFKEAVLVDQPSVKESKKTVGAVLDEAGVTVRGFVRFEIGTA
ncbi:elongation factor Ts [Haloactinopolyspora alba]|uniref:Elongation factor Ts n=1 Tax=Haloactinopolyspora alba TaxID=648780 RepID=A0A2P8DVE3_9ACTN|nr:translation elongation factor Ts [Haloactinopolyspora alba]PSL01175.1 elongation factor Ts [Haloactinopolyspora alba]